MYSLHCTKKLLDRIRPPIEVSLPPPPPTTLLGNWYATALFWKPQLALFVNERTLLPVLTLLAPASTLAARFPVELAAALKLLGASQALVESEVVAMSEITIAKTVNRSVVGIMNEFSFLAEGYREYLGRRLDDPIDALGRHALQPDQIQQPGAATQGGLERCGTLILRTASASLAARLTTSRAVQSEPSRYGKPDG